ncbi:MAG: methyltransferase domain-containing protein [Streptosporangiales bacterium]|nr:methyltransferase domain-containing protein [Streptosporangiales bacterium]MBO0892304.1 methyltransferase domain-containing protein [Acidothermales bacterium]
MARPTPPRRSVRTAVVWDVLAPLVAEPAAGTGLVVVDLGGGTGGFAVPLAELGHDVTVVDESADALAILERRAGEHGVRVRAVQGDATDLVAITGASGADLVLCHSVLEYVDEPAAALAAVRAVLRPGGSVSVLAANRVAAVVHRALAGRFAEARRTLDDGAGRSGPDDQVARRFTLGGLTALLGEAGLVACAVHGVRVFADLVPGGVIDGESGGGEALLGLERAAATDAELRALATQLHVLAVPG